MCEYVCMCFVKRAGFVICMYVVTVAIIHYGWWLLLIQTSKIPPAKSVIPCKFGVRCTQKASCPFLHPIHTNKRLVVKGESAYKCMCLCPTRDTGHDAVSVMMRFVALQMNER